MNIIIFSKNRACQLDLLMRSIRKYWKNYDNFNFIVLYKYTTEDFKRGYESLDKKYFRFNLEGINFKNQLLDLIDTDLKYTTFLCDDNCFIDYFDSNCYEMKVFEANHNITCLSLRLCQRINYHYELGKQVPAKENTWEWKKYNVDWGYPFSIEGNIFRTNEIKDIIKVTSVNHCCNLEIEFKKHSGLFKPKMICFDNSKIFGNPINMVQSIHSNKSENISLTDLNTRFLHGNCIRLYQKVYNDSIHYYVPLKWGKR